MLRRFALLPVLAALLLPACADDNALVLADAANDAAAAAAVKQSLVAHAADLHTAAVALQAAAPPPGSPGWNATTDRAAIVAMKEQWQQARLAFEALEGAVDVFFPDVEASIDLRYEQALAIGTVADPFDGRGFTGFHAIERILWSDSIPSAVRAYELTLPGHWAAAFPASEFEVTEFQNALCQQLVDVTGSLQARVQALSLDSPGAYQTAVHLLKDQLTKMEEAGAGKDESRYARYTLAEMRVNEATAEATEAAFHRWLLSKQVGVPVDAGAMVDAGPPPTGPQIDMAIAAGFAQLDAAYGCTPGNGLSPPAGWSSIDPTDAMIGTSPFGGLFLAVSGADDETNPGSLLSAMAQAIQVLGILPNTPDGGVDAGLPGDTDGT
jgi:iron uptake system component EfeO